MDTRFVSVTMKNFMVENKIHVMVIIGSRPIHLLAKIPSGKSRIIEDSDLTIYYESESQSTRVENFVNQFKDQLKGKIQFVEIPNCLKHYKTYTKCFKLLPGSALQTTRFFLINYIRRVVNLLN